MLRLLTASVGLCLCAYAQESALAVYLNAPGNLSPSILQSMQGETQRLLKSLDTPLLWRETATPQEDSGRLVVVRFIGSCFFEDYNASRPVTPVKGQPLASTAIANGRVLPFVSVQCSRVRDLIAPSVIGMRSSDRDVALGKAIGRVMAHEIYHVLSGDRKHSETGVAAECMSMRDLLAPRFELDTISLAQMKQVRPEPVVADELEADLLTSSGR